MNSKQNLCWVIRSLRWTQSNDHIHSAPCWCRSLYRVCSIHTQYCNTYTRQLLPTLVVKNLTTLLCTEQSAMQKRRHSKSRTQQVKIHITLQYSLTACVTLQFNSGSSENAAQIFSTPSCAIEPFLRIQWQFFIGE